MMPIQLILTLAPYVATALSLILTTILICRVRKSVNRLRNRLAKCEARIQADAAQYAAKLNSMKEEFTGREPADTTGGSTLAGGSGLNSTVRSKVLKMHRMGHSPDNIAEILRVPRGEVELLVKVHRIVMRPYEGVPAGAMHGEAV